MIEQRTVTTAKRIMKEAPEGDYTAKHDAADTRVVHIFKANVPEDGFDREKLRRLAQENAKLKAENTEMKAILSGGADKEIEKLQAVLKEKDLRIDKLEKALIEATIR